MTNHKTPAGMSRAQIDINKSNTTVFSSARRPDDHDLKFDFEIHTDVDLEIGDEFTVNGISRTKVIEIRDLLTDADRHHGDIINRHFYKVVGELVAPPKNRRGGE